MLRQTIFITLFLAGTMSAVFAQVKPLAKDLGLGFRIQGLSNLSINEWSADDFEIPQALIRYYVTDKLVLRAGLGFNSNNTTRDFTTAYFDNTDPNDPIRIDSSMNISNSQIGVNLSPGMEFHLAQEAPKLDPYVGIELPISVLTPASSTVDSEITWTNSGGEVQYREDLNTKTETQGGLSAGLNLLVGFNYFLTSNIAIGAEYRAGAFFSQVGGNVRIATTGVIQPTNNPDNQVSVSTNETFQDLNSEVGLQLGATGGINLSVFW